MMHVRRRGRRGQAFVELALVLPILVLLSGGAADLARAYFMGIEASNGAAAAAMYVAEHASNTASAPSGPTEFTSSQLAAVVNASYGGSLLSCPTVTVSQSQSLTPTGPSSTNSNSYPSKSFYEYVTVICGFYPLTPFFPVSMTLRATSSDYVLEP